MAVSHRRSNPGFGVDYQVLWGRLEERFLELQKAAAIPCCTEKDHINISRWQGMYGAFGTAYNEMQNMIAEARGDKPTEG